MDRWLRVLRAGRLSVGLVEDRAHRGGDERLSCLGHLGGEVADERTNLSFWRESSPSPHRHPASGWLPSPLIRGMGERSKPTGQHPEPTMRARRTPAMFLGRSQAAAGPAGGRFRIDAGLDREPSGGVASATEGLALNLGKGGRRKMVKPAPGVQRVATRHLAIRPAGAERRAVRYASAASFAPDAGRRPPTQAPSASRARSANVVR